MKIPVAKYLLKATKRTNKSHSPFFSLIGMHNFDSNEPSQSIGWQRERNVCSHKQFINRFSMHWVCEKQEQTRTSPFGEEIVCMKWFRQHTVLKYELAGLFHFICSYFSFSVPLFSYVASAPTAIIRLNRSLLSALLKTRTMPNKRRFKVNYLLEINFSNRLVQEWRSFYTRLIRNERMETKAKRAKKFMDFKGRRKRKRNLNHYTSLPLEWKWSW